MSDFDEILETEGDKLTEGLPELVKVLAETFFKIMGKCFKRFPERAAL